MSDRSGAAVVLQRRGLDEQALLEVPRAAALGLELVDLPQRPLGQADGHVGLAGQPDQRVALDVGQLEVAVVVEVAEDQRGDPTLGVIELQEAQLRLEVVGEVLPLDQVRLEGREVLGGDVVLVRGGGGLVELVAVEVGVPVDLRGPLALDLLGALRDLGLQDLDRASRRLPPRGWPRPGPSRRCCLRRSRPAARGGGWSPSPPGRSPGAPSGTAEAA